MIDNILESDLKILVEKVFSMRVAQKLYFSTRDKEDLLAAKIEEKGVDEMLARIRRHLRNEHEEAVS